MDNLITSCFECNRGKAAGLLAVAPQTVIDKAAVIAEKMSQLKAFEKLQRDKRKSEEQSIDMVEQTFMSYFEFQFKDRFRESVRTFLKYMTVYEVMDAMNRACSRINRHEDAIKYFCGICWKIIKEKKNVEPF